MTASETPCLPSFFLESGLNYLRLELKDKERIADKADAYQRRHNPGKPSATMAAFVALAIPDVSYSNRRWMSVGSIATAFDCCKETVKKRIRQIKGAKR
jgi:hypothetical protein